MSRLLSAPLLIVVGCAVEPTPVTERDEETVAALLDAVDVHRAVSLALQPEDTLELGTRCRVDDALLPEHLSPGTMRWAGPCILDDGARFEGILTHSPTDTGSVLSAEGVQITSADELEVSLSGAIEVIRVDDLLQLQVSVQACGTLGPACFSEAPTGGLDLDYSIFPMRTYPAEYSVSVSGAVEGAGSFVSIEGTWHTLREACNTEPHVGSVALGTSPRQTLTMAGEEACDGCVAWRVEGVEVAPFCSESIW